MTTKKDSSILNKTILEATEDRGSELGGAPGSALLYEADDRNVICPYCGASYQAEAEDFDENVRDEECGYCGKIYELWQEIGVTNHTAAKPNVKAQPRAEDKP